MSAAGQIEEPPSHLRYRRALSLRRAMAELWDSRELIRGLVEREFRAQYKQAALGVAWALITPVAFMVVFSFLFPRVASIDTGGVPYPLFTYVGLLPWTFFSTAVMRGGLSLLGNAAILNRVYCPREVFAIAGVVSAAIDTAIAALVLGALFVVSGITPKPTALIAPVLLIIQLAFTLGVTLAVAALVVYFRDVRHALPLLLQFGILATPVAYGIEVIPASARLLYAIANPLGPVIDGYRRTVLLGNLPHWEHLLAAAASSACILLAAYLVFKRLETGFADVV